MKVSLIFDATVKSQKKQYCIQRIKAVVQDIKKKDKNGQSYSLKNIKKIGNKQRCLHALQNQQNLNSHELDNQQVTFRDRNLKQQLFKNITNVISFNKQEDSKINQQKRKCTYKNHFHQNKLSDYQKYDKNNFVGSDIFSQLNQQKKQKQLIKIGNKNNETNLKRCQYSYIYQDNQQSRNAQQFQQNWKVKQFQLSSKTKHLSKQQETEKERDYLNKSIWYMKQIQQKIDQQMKIYSNLVFKVDQLNSKLIMIESQIKKFQSFKIIGQNLLNQSKYQQQTGKYNLSIVADYKKDQKYDLINQFDKKFNRLESIYSSLIKNSVFNSELIKCQKQTLEKNCSSNLVLA